ncbi:hypothetical protein HKW72_38555, partial [Pseudomonas aeruginosa]|nr:hypothetical protein [Pseudomonas aeruginosa]
MKKVKPIHQNRLLLQLDGQLLDSPKGRLFVDSITGAFTDLSGVRILRCGVDTVRQLYNGKLRPEVMALFDLSVDVVEFAGYEWSKGRIG